LKEIRVSNGEQVPLDRIEAEIRRAIRYEKEDRMSKIKELLNTGKSLNDIGKVMNLPKSTVRRFIKQLRLLEPPPEEASLVPEGVSRPKGA
jgi:DNA-binding NarL/FixJ family response regulator